LVSLGSFTAAVASDSLTRRLLTAALRETVCAPSSSSCEVVPAPAPTEVVTRRRRQRRLQARNGTTLQVPEWEQQFQVSQSQDALAGTVDMPALTTAAIRQELADTYLSDKNVTVLGEPTLTSLAADVRVESEVPTAVGREQDFAQQIVEGALELEATAELQRELNTTLGVGLPLTTSDVVTMFYMPPSTPPPQAPPPAPDTYGEDGVNDEISNLNEGDSNADSGPSAAIVLYIVIPILICVAVVCCIAFKDRREFKALREKVRSGMKPADQPVIDVQPLKVFHNAGPGDNPPTAATMVLPPKRRSFMVASEYDGGTELWQVEVDVVDPAPPYGEPPLET